MNIIVTGASQGIGFELVKKFSQDKQNVIIAISRNMQRLRTLQGVCKNINMEAKVHAIKYDITSENVEGELLPELLKHIDKVDILINNAGILINKPFYETSNSDFDKTFNVNVKAPFEIIKALFPYFSKKAHIVNIGSMGGVQGSMKFPGLAIYSASKGALAVLTEALAEELKESNISINCLALGGADTKMLRQAFPHYKPPLSAEEMSEFICNFALTGNRFFNGKILPVSVSTP